MNFWMPLGQDNSVTPANNNRLPKIRIITVLIIVNNGNRIKRYYFSTELENELDFIELTSSWRAALVVFNRSTPWTKQLFDCFRSLFSRLRFLNSLFISNSISIMNLAYLGIRSAPVVRRAFKRTSSSDCDERETFPLIFCTCWRSELAVEWVWTIFDHRNG